MQIKGLLVGLVALGALAGCFETDSERAVAGAVGGAVAADVLDENVVAGAALGAAAGALCDDVNLCPPSY
ncbi:MAG: hypothetical protein D6688_11305 [Alphaproteobacteria bacterium]|nr:MAG: hypothetical protein D6688_11305 [Alphaproteobacteria bacterium]